MIDQLYNGLSDETQEFTQHTCVSSIRDIVIYQFFIGGHVGVPRSENGAAQVRMMVRRRIETKKRGVLTLFVEIYRRQHRTVRRAFS